MSEKTIWTLIVVSGLALLGVLAWRRGLFAKVFPPPKLGQQLPFPGGIGANEYAAASPSGGKLTYGQACTAIYQTAGKVAIAVGDPATKVGGAAAVLGGPAICAGQEYVAGKVWDGSKWVASSTASAAKSAWNNTIGKLF